MREIKFRAWVFSENRYYTQCIHTDKYVYRLKNIESADGKFNSIKVHFDVPLKIKWFSNTPNEEPNFVLEQFTGLKDKNGIDIYERDIISNLFTKYCIHFFKGMFVAVQIGLDINEENAYRIEYLTEKPNNCVVYGNINQDPELLK